VVYLADEPEHQQFDCAVDSVPGFPWLELEMILGKYVGAWAEKKLSLEREVGAWFGKELSLDGKVPLGRRPAERWDWTGSPLGED
jgi:hypothetical protein